MEPRPNGEDVPMFAGYPTVFQHHDADDAPPNCAGRVQKLRRKLTAIPEQEKNVKSHVENNSFVTAVLYNLPGDLQSSKQGVISTAVQRREKPHACHKIFN